MRGTDRDPVTYVNLKKIVKITDDGEDINIHYEGCSYNEEVTVSGGEAEELRIYLSHLSWSLPFRKTQKKKEHEEVDIPDNVRAKGRYRDRDMSGIRPNGFGGFDHGGVNLDDDDDRPLQAGTIEALPRSADDPPGDVFFSEEQRRRRREIH